MKREEFDKLVGSNVVRIRKSRGISQSAVGDFLDITFQQVQKYEKGVNSFRFYSIVELAKLFRCENADFLSGRPASEKLTVGKAFDLLHIAFVETLHVVSLSKAIPSMEIQARCRQLEMMHGQIDELRTYIVRKER